MNVGGNFHENTYCGLLLISASKSSYIFSYLSHVLPLKENIDKYIDYEALLLHWMVMGYKELLEQNLSVGYSR